MPHRKRPLMSGSWQMRFAGDELLTTHYDGVRMGAIASQITSLTIVYSTVYSDAIKRKHQSSTSLAFVWGIHRGRWIPRTKGQLRGKCFHLMTSSWELFSYACRFQSHYWLAWLIAWWQQTAWMTQTDLDVALHSWERHFMETLFT